MNNRRSTISYLIASLVAAFCLFFSAVPALAVPAEITADVPATTQKLIDTAKTTLRQSTEFAITQALLTALDTATQRLAQATATWVASGDVGQGPLIFTKEFGSWGQDLFLDTVSDALNNFTKTAYGFGICQPLDASISLRIKLGIARVYAPKPSCSYNQFKKALGGTFNNIESGKFLQGISASVEMGQSPLSFAVNTQFTAADKAQQNKLDQAAKRLSSNGFKDLTGPISGNTKTPAVMIEEATKTTVTKANATDEAKATATLNKTDLLAAIGANAARVFTSTLASKLLDKYLKKGMITGADVVCKTPAGAAFDICKGVVDEQLAAGTNGNGATGANLAATYFASVFTPTVSVIDDYSPINDLSACPGAEARGVWNCVIDQSFVSALSLQSGGYLTVRDAIKQGMLHGSWELIPPSDSRNNKFDCYANAYCYTNLVKLRRLRIIPVGWEMATSADTAPAHNNITLQGAIDKFADKTSPYYHLVDPDWVLKIPVTQCRQMVNGQTLSAPNTGDRAQVCADTPSCVSEDGEGKCTGGFGYCTREHGVWTVDATACPAQFATCGAFTDPTGKELAVLTNTVDSAACTAGNAGCRPYATVGSPVGWVNGGATAYLNSKAVKCDAAGAGCQELRQVKSAVTANLFPNPDLETPNVDGSMAAKWGSIGGEYVRDGIDSYEGNAAFHIAAGGGGLSLGGYYGNGGSSPVAPQDYVDIKVAPKALYTLSFYAKRHGAAPTGNLLIKAFDSIFYGTPHVCSGARDADGNLVLTPMPGCLQNMAGDVAYQPTCATTGSGAIGCAIADNFEYGYSMDSSAFSLNFPLSTGYERYTMTFATSSNTHYLGFTWSGDDYYLDALQLEIGPTATAFHVGGTDNAGKAFDIKVAPEYLGCTGEPDFDAGKGCEAYTPVCRQSEVGCDLFTPADGSVAIPAVTSSNDVCSSRCVGYNTFKQEKTLWEGSRFPLYFIPSTAKTCQMADVGCDEFTNLEKAAAGGEAREYYSYVRACRQPDAVNDGTYFTWEGSDVSGFQLKSYVLRNNAGADGTMFNVANTAGVYFIQKTASNATGPVYLAGTDPSACTQSVYRPGAGLTSSNPDCREFIDANGNIFYRLLSATVASTVDCKTYRKTASTQTDCSGSGGIWNGGVNSCDYFVYAAQSNSCAAAANGCRAFTGNQGNNAATVFNSDFESNNADNWTGGVISNEATAVGEHSYGAVAMERKLIGSDGKSLLTQGRLYTLTFWAKGSGQLSSRLSMNGDFATNGHNIFSDSTGLTTPQRLLTTEWQRFVLGPVTMDWAPAASDALRLGVDNGAGFFDNVQLTEMQDRFALIKDSWVTPAVCDQTPAGQPLPQAQLGCAEYQNNSGSTVDLKSFDHLCRQSSVGCEAFTNAHGTDTPFASYHYVSCSIAGAGGAVTGPCLLKGQTVCNIPDTEQTCRFNFDGSSSQLAPETVGGLTYTYSLSDAFGVPADSTSYLVNNGTGSCDAASVGCTSFGDNDLSKLAKCTLGTSAGNVRPCPAGASGGAIQCYVAPGLTECSYRIPFAVNAKTVYLLIRPSDTLDNQLCSAAAVGCNAWTKGGGQLSYFKDPGAAICEYQDKATLNGNDVSGWFKKGTSEPCDPTFAVGGTAYNIRKNGDPEFSPNNFAGACKIEVSGCTEFTDHSDTGKTLPNGKPEFAQGRPFYYVNDSKISDAVKACNNQVSKKQGCLALDQTDNPNKSISTAATYASSDSQNFKLIPPVDGGTQTPPVANDANIVLKVSRDRVCSEWLECATEQTVTDAKTGRDTTRCLTLGTCTQKGADGRCLVWGRLPDTPGAPLGLGAKGAYQTGVYAARDVTSSGNDYSGFSIPNKAPVSFYKQSVSAPYSLNASGTLVPQTCMAYPEADSPFPRTVLNDPNDSVKGHKSGFDNANVCETSVGNKDCECSYRKAVYGASTNKYFPTTAESGIKADGTPGEIKAAICSGGPYDGQECVVLATGNRTANNLTCINGTQEGACDPVGKIDSLLGQKGYCLEKDNTIAVNGSADSACITWLPIDTPKGLDTANQFTSAAFIPKIGQERYCAAPAKYCVPHDCQSPVDIPLFCTEIAATTFKWTPVGGATDSEISSCFNACPGGSGTVAQGGQPDCRAKSKVCVDVVNRYCTKLKAYDCVQATKNDQNCPQFDPAKPGSSYCDDIYTRCVEYRTSGIDFCTNMEKNKCLEKNDTNEYNYGGNWMCVGDILLPNGEAHYAVGDAYNYFNQVPTFNVDSFCGYKFGTDPGSVWSPENGITSCASSGKFCGNGETCTPGQSCIAMNNLSINQNEYTAQEAQETYCLHPTLASVRRSSNSSGYPLLCAKENAIVYNTKPNLGAVTMFGAATSSSDGNTLPLLSSNSLRFVFSKQEGDWVNVFNVTKAVDASSGGYEITLPDGSTQVVYQASNATNVCTEENHCSLATGGSGIIGSYPLDFLGLYYFRTPGATAEYKLVSPSLLLLSQIERVTIKMLSNGNNGLCQYGARIDNEATGECFDSLNLNPARQKGLFALPNSGYGSVNYGYDPGDASIGDDQNITVDRRASNLVLTSSNNWTAQAIGNWGGQTFKLLVSDSEPKRVTGISVELSTGSHTGREYTYVSALDIHMAGPVCGEAVYVGSSNPTAETNVAKAYTNSVLTVRGAVTSVNGANGITITKPDGCDPWGAFASSNPVTVVTSSLASKICEIAKGAIFAGTSQLQQLFASVPAIGQFSNTYSPGAFSAPFYSYLDNLVLSSPWDATIASGVNGPAIVSALCTGSAGDQCTAGAANSLAINGSDTGYVAGNGSLRANLKFYAAADKNQLPIKSVKIDWNDGSDIVDPGSLNYYKNRDATNCGKANAFFGQTTESCDSKPFSYSHVYGYSTGCRVAAPIDYPEIGVKAGGDVCIFKPTVTVTDNWGAGASKPVTSTVQVVVAP